MNSSLILLFYPDNFLGNDQEKEMEMDRKREHEMASKAVNEITKNRVPRNRTDTLQSQNQKSSKKTGNKGKPGKFEKQNSNHFEYTITNPNYTLKAIPGDISVL